jgi:GTP cyclohydrolase II/3,4-dihydroxy 2-butanone 4-phosphate synthase/GTP cyclohydrolase II
LAGLDASKKAMTLERYAEAELPTEHGPFRLIVYRNGEVPPAASGQPPAATPLVEEHMAIVRGDLSRGSNILCRVHSECWTSEVLGSMKCDCREQLDAALEKIAHEGAGVVIYLRQEGRGIGLGNKIRAYDLQNHGADTVEANLRLGFEADARSYDLAAEILRDLGIRSVRLLTNNPLKVAGLEAAGIKVGERQPLWVGENQHNQGYLAVKRRKMGHHPDVPIKLRALPGVRK